MSRKGKGREGRRERTAGGQDGSFRLGRQTDSPPAKRETPLPAGAEGNAASSTGGFRGLVERIDFVRYRRVYYLITLAFLVFGGIALAWRGLNLGVDFTSGTRIEVKVGKEFTDEEVYGLLKDHPPSLVERVGVGESTSLVLRYKRVLSQEEVERVRELLSRHFGGDLTPTVSTIDPLVGRELARNAVYSTLLAALGIVLYMTIRFEYRMALAGIASIFSVVGIVVGLIALLQVEVDVTFITAILTIVGYAISDTVIVFDRIRENRQLREPRDAEGYISLVNASIRQVFVRSVNTVLTVLFASLALLVLGGPGLYTFALTLTLGLFFGAYASLATASQLWLDWILWDLRRGRLRPARA
ncbi:MAG: Protein-export membrane protein SecF [Brockia lithotrophica]|uniref:Protein-export membrane protein SecF n=1 Tax=Brockia lithotrophica TaxID=933949 RepID=A0A2T5G749_9BACL|nr:MAG: Protein-export membrane protein SecF [Brockia lithotrophica]